MAERIEAMPDVPKRTNNRYPWNEWFDGSAWELIQGKDFECPVEAMRSTIKSAAGIRRVAVVIIARGDRVYLQAQR